MIFTTDYRLENFLLNTEWEDLPPKVQERSEVCFLDLLGALALGSRSRQFAAGLSMAHRVFGGGDTALLGSFTRLSRVGAAAAMAHASNAFDIDDGHNTIRAHPGTSFIGGLLAAAYEKNTPYWEFLSALTVSYEATIRFGKAVMDFYDFPHSSGTFGAFGTAAGVGRILGLSPQKLNNALSVADFNAPLVPGSRSVEYPSMNKDGVPFGVMAGMLALEATLSGFSGNKNLLEAEPYSSLLDDLGENYEIMNLYFKPYPCCRWAHPAIDAVLCLVEEHKISADDIENVQILTFEGATRLCKAPPKSTDEAQYNIAYPIAAAIVSKGLGFSEVIEENLHNEQTLQMMGRLQFFVDPSFEAQFPQRRLCRAKIFLKNGICLESGECEPRGEAQDDVGMEWIVHKFLDLTSPVLTDLGQETFVKLSGGDENLGIAKLVDILNREDNWKKRQIGALL